MEIDNGIMTYDAPKNHLKYNKASTKIYKKLFENGSSNLIKLQPYLGFPAYELTRKSGL